MTIVPRRRGHYHAVLVIAAAAAALLSMPVRAAVGLPDEPLPSPRIERTRSELVLIEVFAVDKEGRPVLDLKPGDLVLRIDGNRRPAPIQSLELTGIADSGGSVAAAAVGSQAGAVEAPGTQAAEPGAAVAFPRRFLLFFEDSLSAPEVMSAARLAALDMVRTAGRASDEFALASYDAQGNLNVLHDFTADREVLTGVLQRNLEDARRFSDYGVVKQERRDGLVDMARQAGLLVSGSDMQADTPIVSAPNQLENPLTQSRNQRAGAQVEQMELRRTVEDLARSYAWEDSVAMSRVLSALGTLVDALSSWPGYKAVVFLGDGIPENPALDYGLNETRESLAADLSGLSRAVSGANVTLHVVEPNGLQTGDAVETASASRRSNSLAALALTSGGLHTATNDLAAALAGVERQSESYYVLAYAPEGAPDGRHHTVKIASKRRDVHLRYRQGFIRFTPDEERARALQAAFLAPDLNHSLGLQAVAVAGAGSAGKQVYDLVLYVPPGRLLFLPDPAGVAAQIDLGLVVMGDYGTETLRLSRRVRVTQSAARAIATGAPAINVVSRVTLPRGSRTLTAVVADDQSGEIGAARLAIDAHGGDGQAITGLSLYATEEKSLWVEIGPRARTAAGGPAAAPTLGPAVRGRFFRGEKLTCAFRAAGAPDAVPSGLRVEVLRGTELVQVRPIVAPDLGTFHEGEGALVHADLMTAGMDEGGYLLRVRADGAVGPVDLALLPFEIAPPAAR